MKKWTSFFGLKQSLLDSLPKINYHWDGISFPTISFRLSNIPKNWRLMVNFLSVLGQQEPTLLFSATLLYLIKQGKVYGCDQFSGSYSRLYLNHSQGDGFLSVKYSEDYMLGEINNTCNFTIADRQLVSYESLGCLCYDGGAAADISEHGYKVLLSGQNVTVEALNCIKNFLIANCDKSPPSEAAMAWIAFGVLVCFTVCGLYACGQASLESLGPYLDHCRTFINRYGSVFSSRYDSFFRSREDQPSLLLSEPEEDQGLSAHPADIPEIPAENKVKGLNSNKIFQKNLRKEDFQPTDNKEEKSLAGIAADIPLKTITFVRSREGRPPMLLSEPEENQVLSAQPTEIPLETITTIRIITPN